MNNLTNSNKVQVQSFGNYLNDVWIIALLFVFIQHLTTISLPFIWIGLQLIIAIIASLVYSKTGPNLIVALVVPTVALLPLFLIGAPLWLYIISLGISIWRIQARFHTMQDEQTLDGSFTLLFCTTFLGVYLLCLFMKFQGYSTTLFILLIGGMTLFVGVRLFSIWVHTDKRNSLSFQQLLLVYIAGILGVTVLTSFIYWIVDDIREMVDELIAVIISLAIIPLGPFIEYLVNLIDKFRKESGPLSELIPNIKQPNIDANNAISKSFSTDFPFEWFIAAVVVVIILIAIVKIVKRKPEESKVEMNNLQYENKIMSVVEKQNSETKSLYVVESSILREKYLQFEIEAKVYELGRVNSETVREWFKRMDWLVENRFFSIYEEVRYGGQVIESSKADLFIKTLEETKKNYFVKKDV
ncbi:hypothetical protein [Psychrobacillus vulpis]|uniref:DUF4129 domain-containing protein n=1 Tax=Psychrobacillus vulpis TaxID=2325572 RepID=A0A544TRV1_9BACI|nr:hypothetical protein [Psychrobacillus vulpis]TQR20176.1 hypothetical protein FG384_08410 [Psychrobacillus vulpis]